MRNEQTQRPAAAWQELVDPHLVPTPLGANVCKAWFGASYGSNEAEALQLIETVFTDAKPYPVAGLGKPLDMHDDVITRIYPAWAKDRGMVNMGMLALSSLNDKARRLP